MSDDSTFTREKLSDALAVVCRQLDKAIAERDEARRAARDYHRRSQKMAAALSRAMEGGGPSFGRALANAGHCAQRTLRETADAELAAYKTQFDGDLTPDEGSAAFDMAQECGHDLTWVQRDRVCREIRRRRLP